MAAQEQSAERPPDFGLPEEVLSVIPSDPFEQLDVARKITSIALATRISKLESEASRLRQRLAEKDDLVAELRAKVETIDASLADVSDRLARADEEKVFLFLSNFFPHSYMSICFRIRVILNGFSVFGCVQETLLNENASLSDTIKKLNRDVSKVRFSLHFLVSLPLFF